AGRAQLMAERRGAEQLVEQPLRVLRDLVEALLELRCRVHTVPARYSGRLSMRSAAISPAPNVPSGNTHLTWVFGARRRSIVTAVPKNAAIPAPLRRLPSP